MKHIKLFEDFNNPDKKLEDFTVDDVLNMIDYTEYKNLYPNYDSYDQEFYEDYKFDSKEHAERYAQDILNVFLELPKDEITIYRAIKVKSIEDITFDNLGESWSFERQAAINFAKNHNHGNILLTAKIKPEDVDWDSTLEHFVDFSNNYDSYDEYELKVHDWKVYNVEYEKI